MGPSERVDNFAYRRVQPIRKVCPRCGSENVIPIIYGYQTRELNERVKAEEVAYGGRATYEGMPTHKCMSCYSTFAVGRRRGLVLSTAKPISSFILASFVGYYVGSATIVGDSVVMSAILQVFSGSIAPATPVADLVIWALGVFAAAGLLAIGAVTRDKTIIFGGLGYVAGFLCSAWLLGAWWTTAIEVVSLILFLMSYAILSE